MEQSVDAIVKCVCILHNLIIDLKGVDKLLQFVQNTMGNLQHNRAVNDEYLSAYGVHVRDELMSFLWKNMNFCKNT